MQMFHVMLQQRVTGALSASILGLSLVACSGADPETNVSYKDAPISKPVADSKSISTKAIERESHSPATSDIRSADSHIHGGATLSIAVEKSVVFVELETPIYNLLGFEYKPRSAEETSRVQEVETLLARPSNVLRFNESADCTYDALPETPKLFTVSHAAHEENNSHDHHEKNDQDHHDDHASENHASQDHDEEHDDGHKDVILSYVLKCNKSEDLESVQVELFKEFPNFSDLELVYLGQTKQLSADLTPSQPKANLSK